jgi:hypothetical protein
LNFAFPIEFLIARNSAFLAALRRYFRHCEQSVLVLPSACSTGSFQVSDEQWRHVMAIGPAEEVGGSAASPPPSVGAAIKAEFDQELEAARRGGPAASFAHVRQRFAFTAPWPPGQQTATDGVPAPKADTAGPGRDSVWLRLLQLALRRSLVGLGVYAAEKMDVSAQSKRTITEFYGSDLRLRV